MVPLSHQKHEMSSYLLWKFGAVSLEPRYLLSTEKATFISKVPIKWKKKPVLSILLKHLCVIISLFYSVLGTLYKLQFLGMPCLWRELSCQVSSVGEALHFLLIRHWDMVRDGDEASLYSRPCAAELERRSEWRPGGSGTGAGLLSQGQWVLQFSGPQITYLSAGEFEVGRGQEPSKPQNHWVLWLFSTLLAKHILKFISCPPYLMVGTCASYSEHY